MTAQCRHQLSVVRMTVETTVGAGGHEDRDGQHLPGSAEQTGEARSVIIVAALAAEGSRLPGGREAP